MRTIPENNPSQGGGQQQEPLNTQEEAKQEQQQQTEQAKNKAKVGGKKIINWILKHKEFIMSHLPAIGIALLVIVGIIFIVGLISFFANMPGMVFSQMIETCKGFWKRAWSNQVEFITGDATTVRIDSDDTKELAQYLENMGYSIEGYGFGDVHYSQNDPNSNGKTKQIDKVTPITGPDGKRNYLQAYLAANESSYQLADYSLWGELQAAGATYKSKLLTLNGLLGEVQAKEASDFSTGMIEILGRKELALSIFGVDLPWSVSLDKQATRVKIDRETEKMTISEHSIPMADNVLGGIKNILNGGWSQETGGITWGSQFSFDLSDWTSIYGRPLELFIALHVGTMMPDLTYNLATEKAFNTKVRIVLTDVEMTFDKLQISGNDISTSDVMDAYFFSSFAFDGYGKQREVLEALVNQCDSMGPDRIYTKAFFAKMIAKTHREYWLFGGDDEVSLNTVVNELAWPALTAVLDSFDTYYVTPDGDIIDTKTLTFISDDDSQACSINGVSFTYKQLNELATLVCTGINSEDFEKAGVPLNGVWYKWWDGLSTDNLGVDTALPTISSVRNHWFYYDWYFTYTTPDDGQGVYNTTKYATKLIDFQDVNEKSTLNNVGEIKIQALFKARKDPGIYYQVNEPYVKGPKPETVELFKQEYYRYDGTPETARNIAIAKRIDRGSSAGSKFTYEDEPYYITADDAAKHADGELAIKALPSFGSPSDALSAFAILENVKTPAADAVYRMLKELLTSSELQYFTEEELTEDLTQVLVWPIVNPSDKKYASNVKRDPGSYGIVIENENGKEVIAPGDGEIISSSGDEVKIKFSALRDETIEWLEKYYKGEFYRVTKDEVTNMVMTISGINVSKGSGKVERNEKIGTATSEVKVYFEHDDKTIVGQGVTTVDDDIEDYIYPNYTKEEDTVEEETHDIAYGGAIIPEDTDDAKTYDPAAERIDKKDDTDYTEDELLLIYAIVAGEDNADYEGALAVITCAMNRTQDSRWSKYGSSALSQLTAYKQFSAYPATLNNPNFIGYKIYHKQIEVPAHVKQAVDDCLNSGKRNHKYLSFRGGKNITEAMSNGAPADAVPIGHPNKGPWNWYFSEMNSTSGGGPNVTPQAGDGYVSSVTASNGRTYKYYKQAWYKNNARYNTTKADSDAAKQIASAGCGICSESIVLSGFGVEQTPWDTYWSTGINFGYKLPQAGSVRTATFSQALNEAKTVIPNGGAVILHFNKVGWASNRPGKNPSHYVVCIDYKNEGGKDMYYILNPAAGKDGWVTFDGTESSSGSCRIIGG